MWQAHPDRKTARPLTTFRGVEPLIHERTREVQAAAASCWRTLGPELGCVASDVLGVSGRLMLEALVGGTTDPEVLADLARGALPKQLAVLQEALQGPVARHHRLLVAELLAHLDYLDEAIERLSVEVARVVAPVLAAAGAVVHYPRRGQADRRGDPG